MRGFMGEARRESPAWESGPHTPWHATVKVTPIHLAGRTEFEVLATWHGPPQPGFPPDPRPGDRSDAVMVPNYERARGVAMRAVDQLRTGATDNDGRAKIDLRAIHRRLAERARGPGIEVPGGVILDPVAKDPKPPKS